MLGQIRGGFVQFRPNILDRVQGGPTGGFYLGVTFSIVITDCTVTEALEGGDNVVKAVSNVPRDVAFEGTTWPHHISLIGQRADHSGQLFKHVELRLAIELRWFHVVDLRE